MITLAYILSGISLLMSLLFLVQLPKPPLGFVVLIPKLTAGALSPIWALIGAVGAVLGWLYQAFWAIPVGILGAGMMVWYVWRCTRDHNGFENTFGAGWEDQIPSQQAKHMVKSRWTWFLRIKASPKPPCRSDLLFIKDLLEGEKVTPVIDKRYTLSEVPEALRHLAKGHARGKIIISI